MKRTSTISSFVQDVTADSVGIWIQWGDNRVSHFPYRWLAKNAPEFRHSQGHCGHNPTILPLTIRPRFIHLYQNNVLELGWHEISRNTCFSTVWLRENDFSDQENEVVSHAA